MIDWLNFKQMTYQTTGASTQCYRELRPSIKKLNNSLRYYIYVELAISSDSTQLSVSKMLFNKMILFSI